MKKVKLSRGYYALVDNKDYARVMSGTKWYAWSSYRNDGTLRTIYACRQLSRKKGAKGGTQFMHRLILGLTKTTEHSDHKNGNGIDNRRKNLRAVSALENSQNRVRKSTQNTSGVTGVYWDKHNEKWVAEIIQKGKYRFLGRFKSLPQAKKVRVAAGKERWHSRRKQRLRRSQR